MTGFCVAWAPYAVFALIEQFGDPHFISPAMSVIPALLAKSSIWYNPIIYVGMNSQVRSVFVSESTGSVYLKRFAVVLFLDISQYRSNAFKKMFKIQRVGGTCTTQGATINYTLETSSHGNVIVFHKTNDEGDLRAN